MASECPSLATQSLKSISVSVDCFVASCIFTKRCYIALATTLVPQGLTKCVGSRKRLGQQIWPGPGFPCQPQPALKTHVGVRARAMFQGSSKVLDVSTSDKPQSKSRTRFHVNSVVQSDYSHHLPAFKPSLPHNMPR